MQEMYNSSGHRYSVRLVTAVIGTVQIVLEHGRLKTDQAHNEFGCFRSFDGIDRITALFDVLCQEVSCGALQLDNDVETLQLALRQLFDELYCLQPPASGPTAQPSELDNVQGGWTASWERAKLTSSTWNGSARGLFEDPRGPLHNIEVRLNPEWSQGEVMDVRVSKMAPPR